MLPELVILYCYFHIFCNSIFIVKKILLRRGSLYVVM